METGWILNEMIEIGPVLLKLTVGLGHTARVVPRPFSRLLLKQLSQQQTAVRPASKQLILFKGVFIIDTYEDCMFHCTFSMIIATQASEYQVDRPCPHLSTSCYYNLRVNIENLHKREIIFCQN